MRVPVLVLALAAAVGVAHPACAGVANAQVTDAGIVFVTHNGDVNLVDPATRASRLVASGDGGGVSFKNARGDGHVLCAVHVGVSPGKDLLLMRIAGGKAERLPVRDVEDGLSDVEVRGVAGCDATAVYLWGPTWSADDGLRFDLATGRLSRGHGMGPGRLVVATAGDGSRSLALLVDWPLAHAWLRNEQGAEVALAPSKELPDSERGLVTLGPRGAFAVVGGHAFVVDPAKLEIRADWPVPDALDLLTTVASDERAGWVAGDDGQGKGVLWRLDLDTGAGRFVDLVGGHVVVADDGAHAWLASRGVGVRSFPQRYTKADGSIASVDLKWSPEARKAHRKAVAKALVRGPADAAEGLVWMLVGGAMNRQ